MATTEKPNGGGYVYIPIANINDIAFNQEVAPYIKYKIGDIKYYVDNPNTYDGTTVAKTVAQIINNTNAIDVEYLFNTGYLHNGENTKYNFEQRAFVGETTIKPEDGHISSEHDKLKNFRERKDGSKEDDGLVLIDVKGKAANSFDEIRYRNNGTEVGKNWGYRPRVIWNNWNDTKYIKVLEKRPGANGKPSLHIIDSVGQEYNIELKPQQEVIIAKQRNVIDLSKVVNKQITDINKYVSVQKWQSSDQEWFSKREYEWTNSSSAFPQAAIEKIYTNYASYFTPLTARQVWRKQNQKIEEGYFFTESPYFLQYETTADSHLNFFKLGNNFSQLEEIKEDNKISYCKKCFSHNEDTITPLITLNLQRQLDGRHQTVLPVSKNDKTIFKGERNITINGKLSRYSFLQNWKSADETVRRSNYYYYCGALYNTPVASLDIKPTSNYYNIKSSDISTSITTKTFNGITSPMPANSLEDTGDSIFSAHVNGSKWSNQTQKDEFKTIDFLTQTFNLPPHFALKKTNLPYYCKQDGTTTIDFIPNLFFLDITVREEIQTFYRWLASIKDDIVKGYAALPPSEYTTETPEERYQDFVNQVAIHNVYSPYVPKAFEDIEWDAFTDEDKTALGHYLTDAKRKVANYISIIGSSKNIPQEVRLIIASIGYLYSERLNIFNSDYLKRLIEREQMRAGSETLKMIRKRELKWGDSKLTFDGFLRINCISTTYNTVDGSGYTELHYKMKLKESENAQEQIAILII